MFGPSSIGTLQLSPALVRVVTHISHGTNVGGRCREKNSTRPSADMDGLKSEIVVLIGAPRFSGQFQVLCGDGLVHWYISHRPYGGGIAAEE